MGVRIDLVACGKAVCGRGFRGCRTTSGAFHRRPLLEHSRIYYFGNRWRRAAVPSSADWMERNLDKRVEIPQFPVEGKKLITRVRRNWKPPHRQRGPGCLRAGWSLPAHHAVRQRQPAQRPGGAAGSDRNAVHDRQRTPRPWRWSLLPLTGRAGRGAVYSGLSGLPRGEGMSESRQLLHGDAGSSRRSPAAPSALRCLSPISSCSVCLPAAGPFGFRLAPLPKCRICSRLAGRIQQRQRGDIHQQVMMPGRGHINPGRRHAMPFRPNLTVKVWPTLAPSCGVMKYHLGAFKGSWVSVVGQPGRLASRAGRSAPGAVAK